MSLNIGIIGAGAISETGHIPAVIGTGGFYLKAVVDTDEKRLNYLSKKFNLQCCITDMEKILDKLDCVIIATPPHMHEKIASRAFKAGLHVICEKPLASNAEECRRIIGYAQEAGRKLSVGHNYRFMPNRQYAYSLVKNKPADIKEINIVQGSHASWPTVTGYSFRKELVPGGVLFNEGIHSLDFIYWLLGYPYSIEYLDDSFGGVESNCELTMQHAGVKSSLRLSRTCNLRNTINIVLSDYTIGLNIYNANELIIYRGGKPEIVKLEGPAFNIVDMLSRQLSNFREAIEKDTEPLVSGIDGLEIIRLVEACYGIKKNRQLPDKAPVPGMVW